MRPCSVVHESPKVTGASERLHVGYLQAYGDATGYVKRTRTRKDEAHTSGFGVRVLVGVQSVGQGGMRDSD